MKKLNSTGHKTLSVRAVGQGTSQFRINDVGYLATWIVTFQAVAHHMLGAFVDALKAYEPVEKKFNKLIAKGVDLGPLTNVGHPDKWNPPSHLKKSQVKTCYDHYAKRIAVNNCLVRGSINVYEGDDPFVPVVGESVHVKVLERSRPGTEEIVWLAASISSMPVDNTGDQDLNLKQLVSGGSIGATTTRPDPQEDDSDEEKEDESVDVGDLDAMNVT